MKLVILAPKLFLKIDEIDPSSGPPMYPATAFILLNDVGTGDAAGAAPSIGIDGQSYMTPLLGSQVIVSH